MSQSNESVTATEISMILGNEEDKENEEEGKKVQEKKKVEKERKRKGGKWGFVEEVS